MSALGQWTAEASFESLLDLVEFKPERAADRISPRAIMWVPTEKDKLAPLFEMQSMYAKATQPKKLVVVENMIQGGLS